MKYAYRGNMDGTFQTNKAEDLQSLWVLFQRTSYPADPRLKPVIQKQIQSFTLSDWQGMMARHAEWVKMTEMRKAGQSYIFRPSMPPLEFPKCVGMHKYTILHDPSLLPSTVENGVRIFDVSSCKID